MEVTTFKILVTIALVLNAIILVFIAQWMSYTQKEVKRLGLHKK